MSDRTAAMSEYGTTLTETQRALLRTAVREGYFEVPRRISLVDLAAREGLSDREAAEQLQRGLDVVVREATRED